MFFVLLICSAFLSLALSQFVIVDSTCNDISVGVGAASSSYAINVASDTAGNLYTNIAYNNEWTNTLSSLGLSLDCAINSKGQSYFATSGSIRYSNNSTTYSAVEGAIGTSQSINYLADNEDILALVGTFFVKGKGSATGVVLTQDGKALSLSEIPAYVRYGSFPSSQVWYVSAGTWPEDSVSEGYRAHSKRVSFNHENKKAKVDLSKRRKLQASNETWVAQIFKTTNGGASFDMIFNAPSDADYYFNGISCGDENTCVVVGEGNNADGAPIAVVFTTQDGGSTWVQTINTVNTIYTTMAVKMINNKIGYFAATVKSGRTLSGTFYTTTDGGMTWSVQQELAGCEIILDLDFNADGSAGYATCMSASGTKGCVAQYIQ